MFDFVDFESAKKYYDQSDKEIVFISSGSLKEEALKNMNEQPSKILSLILYVSNEDYHEEFCSHNKE